MRAIPCHHCSVCAGQYCAHRNRADVLDGDDFDLPAPGSPTVTALPSPMLPGAGDCSDD